MRKFVLLFSCLFLFGCAAVTFNQKQEQDVLNQGRAVFGETADFGVFVVPSRGTLADATFVAQSVSSGPSVLAREMAGQFAAGAQKETLLVLSGPSSAKTAQVIKDAFKLNRGRQLSYLQLLFVGEPEHSPEIERVAKSYGAIYFFKQAPMR